MNKEKFIKNAVKGGYCNKKQAEEYCKGKESFTDDDYIAVFRKAENDIVKRHGRALGDGAYTTKHYFSDGGTEGNR